MKRAAWISLAVLVVVALAVPVMAKGPHGVREQRAMFSDSFGPPGQHGPGGLWRDAKLVEHLQLSDEQVESLKQTDFAFRERAISIKAEAEKGQLELDRALSEQNLNESAVKKTAKKLGDLQSQMFVLQVEHKLAVRKVLTDQQVDKLEKLRPPFAREKRRLHRQYMRTFDWENAEPEEQPDELPGKE